MLCGVKASFLLLLALLSGCSREASEPLLAPVTVALLVSAPGRDWQARWSEPGPEGSAWYRGQLGGLRVCLPAAGSMGPARRLVTLRFRVAPGAAVPSRVTVSLPVGEWVTVGADLRSADWWLLDRGDDAGWVELWDKRPAEASEMASGIVGGPDRPKAVSLRLGDDRPVMGE